MEFRDVWQRIEQLEGQTLRTGRGEDFSFRFRKTYVVVSAGDVSIPRTNFEKVFKRSQSGPAATPAVQGQRFITAILTHAGIDHKED
jgi:hypothetical protein